MADSLSNLLHTTELFMVRAGQLAETGFPAEHDDALRRLRRDLLAEEVAEYIDAEKAGDLPKVIDGLLDVIVVAWGTVLAYIGPHTAAEAATEVSVANLRKVTGAGLPLLDRNGKVQKPPGWIAPDIASVLADRDVRQQRG